MKSLEISVPGVDLDDARKRLVDDVPFLLSLLREFVRHSIALESSLSLDGSPASIGDDLRKLHQLRGGAGNLAVQTVEGVSARLELTLKGYVNSTRPEAGSKKVVQELRSKLQGELFALRDALHGASVGITEEEDLVPPRSIRRNTRPMASPDSRRVLIIDDSSAMRNYLRATLQKHDSSMEIFEASDGLDGFQKLTEDRPDLVLCDLQMPKFDGLKLLSMWSNRPGLREIPVIMLTAEHDTDRKVEILERGAADYITKPFHGRELIARVSIHLGVRKLREENRQLSALLDASTSSDELTGVFNRRHFETLLLDEVQRTTRYGVPLSLIMMQLRPTESRSSLDGELLENKLLASTGLLLADAIRATDKAARIAHDKFAILLTHTGQVGAYEVASRLHAALRDPGRDATTRRYESKAAFGLACSEGTPITAKEMLERTEAALSEALLSGGTRVVAWTPSLPTSKGAKT